jgi:hypothetical protein
MPAVQFCSATKQFITFHKTWLLWVEMLKATLQYCFIHAEGEMKENHTQSYLSAPVQSAGTGKRLPAIQGEDRVRIRLGDTLALLTNEERGGAGWRQFKR